MQTRGSLGQRIWRIIDLGMVIYQRQIGPQLGVATANLFPQISLTATASMQANTLHDLFDASAAAGGVAGSLTQP